MQCMRELLWGVVRDKPYAREDEGGCDPRCPSKFTGTRKGTGCKWPLEGRVVVLERDPWSRASKRKLPSEVKGHCDRWVRDLTPGRRDGHLLTIAASTVKFETRWSAVSPRTPATSDKRDEDQEEGHILNNLALCR